MINQIIDFCNKNGEKIFYKTEDECITYKELIDKALDLSLRLPNDHSKIIVYGHKQSMMLISFLACLINGNPYIPVDDFYPDYRVKLIIKESCAKYIINNESDELFSLTNVLKLDKKDDLRISDNLSDTAYIIFTSGSTGIPKGVQVSKKNLYNFIRWINKMIPKSKNMVVYNQASFSFDLSVADIYLSLSNCYSLCSYDSDDFNYIVKRMIDNNVNLLVITPTFAKGLLTCNEFNSSMFSSLDSIFFCGERLEKATVRKLFNKFNNINIYNAYGPTEATCAVSLIKIDKKYLNYDALPVGKISSSACDINIIDKEIVLSGKSVSKGYLNASNDNFINNNGVNTFKTGDIGKIEDGLLYCLGRIDNQIKYKGYRIELEEIEEKINEIKRVDDAACSVRRNDKGDVVAIICYVKGKNITSLYIKEMLKEKLPCYMIPKFIKVVDDIKVNINNKHDRKELA